MQTLEKFLDTSDLSMRCRQVDGDDPFLIVQPAPARRYACELYDSNGARPVTTIIGSDEGPPEILEVLDAIAAEAAVVDEADGYEPWALEMGFNPDSRHDERVYRSVRRRARLLRGLVGDERYEQLLWDTERL
jgi:hypothetical protein